MYLPAFSHHAPVNNITYSGACFCASYWGGDPQDPWIFCCLHGICHVFLPSVGTPEDSPLQMTLTRLQFFKESGEGREGTREKYHCVIVSRVPPTPGVCLLLQACASTGNQTGDPLVHRPMAQSTEPHQPEPKLMYSWSYVNSMELNNNNIFELDGFSLPLSSKHLFLNYPYNVCWRKARDSRYCYINFFEDQET